jgi:hypothetical protein
MPASSRMSNPAPQDATTMINPPVRRQTGPSAVEHAPGGASLPGTGSQSTGSVRVVVLTDLLAPEQEARSHPTATCGALALEVLVRCWW